MRRSEAEVPTIFNPHRVRAPPNLVVTADSSPLQHNQYHRQPSLHHQDSVCQQLGNLQQDGLAEPLHAPPAPSITRCARSCCSSNARKIYSGVLVTICVTASWVGATHFIKYMYLPQAVTPPTTAPTINQSSSTVVVTHSHQHMIYSYNAPFFTTWFCTNWTILFFPLYFIFQLVARKCKSPSEIVAESLRNFRDKGFTIGRFFWRCVCFCLLWVSTNYMYINSLRKLLATDVMALFATNVAFVYLLSWVILHQQFVGIRIVAVIMCDTGIALLAYMDGLSKSPILSSVVLAAFAAASSAVYKVLFKKVIGDASFGQIALFFSLIGLFNALFLWPIVLCLYFTGTEVIYWEYAPWIPLLAAAILSLVANLLGNFSVALTYDLFVTLGLITAVPVSAALDVVLYGEHFFGMKLAGMILIGIGFFLVMLPDNWPDYITRLLRNIILLSHSARWSRRAGQGGTTGPHQRTTIDYRTGYIRSNLRSPSGRVR